MVMKHKVAGARLNGCISTADSSAFMSTSSPWGFQTLKICGIGFAVAAPSCLHLQHVVRSLEPDPDEVGAVRAVARQRRHIDEAVVAAVEIDLAG